MFIQKNNNDLVYALSCVKLVVEISTRTEISKFEDNTGMLFSDSLIKEAGKINELVTAREQCLTGKSNNETEFRMFSRRFSVLLNTFGAILTGWKDFAPEAQEMISRLVHGDVCGEKNREESIIKRLFTRSKVVEYLKRIIIDDNYQDLATYIDEKCKSMSRNPPAPLGTSGCCRPGPLRGA